MIGTDLESLLVKRVFGTGTVGSTANEKRAVRVTKKSVIKFAKPLPAFAPANLFYCSTSPCIVSHSIFMFWRKLHRLLNLC